MQISLTLNGKKITEEIAADLLLIDFEKSWMLQRKARL